MLRLYRAGLALEPLCSSSRLVEPQAYPQLLGGHVISRFFSTSPPHVYKWEYVKDPATGSRKRRTPDAPQPIDEEVADSAACRKAIDEGELPETLFTSRLLAGTLSRAAAAVCLTQASHSGRVEANLGQTALTWLWNQRGSLIYPDDNVLVYTMVDLLVREGQEEGIWRWMRCESPRPKYYPPFIRYEW